MELERRRLLGQRVEMEHAGRLRIGTVSAVRLSSASPGYPREILLDIRGQNFVAMLVPLSVVKLVDESTPSAN